MSAGAAEVPQTTFCFLRPLISVSSHQGQEHMKLA